MNLQESIRRILREETSPEKRLKDFVSSNGFTVAKRVFGDNDKFYESLGLKGTQDDMIFIVNTILKHDIEEDICDFFIVKTLHSIKLYVEVPKANPDKGIDEWANKYDRTLLESKISQKIFSLGNGLVRGHNIKVLPGRC
jgi:hypothetical protein